MLKKAVLAIFFAASITIISLPLLGQLQVDTAKRLEDSFLWQDAQSKYQLAIQYDPWNSRYIAAYADFLRTKGIYWRNKESLFLRAEALYQEALELNPYSAEYALNLGKTRLGLGSVPEAIESLVRALGTDPNGVNIAYEFGYHCLGVWKKLDRVTRGLAINRINYALNHRLWCAKYIYPRAWKNTADFSILQQMTPDNLRANLLLLDFVKDNQLYKLYSKQKEVVDNYRREEDKQDSDLRIREISGLFSRIKENLKLKMQVTGFKPEESFLIQEQDWQGGDNKGEQFKNGKMYVSGAMHAGINLPPYAAQLIVIARAEPANGIYPYMIVELDGKEIGEGFVDAPDWKKYSYFIPEDLKNGLRVVSINYINDGFNRINNEDRNLFIGQVKVE